MPAKHPAPPREQIRGIKTSRASLYYTDSAKRFIRENPGLLDFFIKARKSLKWFRREAHSGGVSVRRLPRRGASNFRCYKVMVGDRVLFVKEQKKGKHGWKFDKETDLAEQQMKSLLKAEEALARFKSDAVDVETAKFRLAKTKGENSFLVTDFYYGVPVSAAPRRIREVFAFAANLLLERNLRDAETYNCLYCPPKDGKKGKIVFFDLREER